MGKLSLKKKDESEKQQKISSFFSKPQEQQKKPTESPLFQTVKSNSSSSTVSKLHVPHAESTIGVKTCTDFPRGCEQTVIPETQCCVTTPVRKDRANEGVGHTENCDSDCEIIPATPDVAAAGSKGRTFGRSFLSSNLSHLPLGGVKPQDKSSKASQKASSGAAKSGSFKSNSRNRTGKQSRSTSKFDGTWNSTDATMSRVLNDMGVPEVARGGLGLDRSGLDPEKASLGTKKADLGLKNDSSFNNQLGNKEGIVPLQISAKRSHPSGDGESPPCKKKQSGCSTLFNDVVCAEIGEEKSNIGLQLGTDQSNSEKTSKTLLSRVEFCENTNGNLQCGAELMKKIEKIDSGKRILGAGTRGRQILENSLKVSLKKGSDSSSGSESDSDNNLNNKQNMCMVGDLENASELRKFSFNRNKGKNRGSVKDNPIDKKHQMKNGKGRMDSKEEVDSESTQDLVLDDILGKMKYGQLENDIKPVEKVPSVAFKKKKTSHQKSLLERENENVCVVAVMLESMDKGEDKPVMIDHTDTDEALQDIMAELKETLTQQNALSAQKSSLKKRQYVYREKDQRLNSSISKQLDFSGNSSLQDSDNPKSEQNGKPAEVQEEKALKHELDDVSPLDGHVTESKACGSLFQEESWIDDHELLALDNTTSPFKEKLNQSSDGLKYNPSEVRAPAEAFGRHTVKQVETQGFDVVLTVEPMQGGMDRKVHLQGFWTDTQVTVGDVIHVIGDFDGAGVCYITDQENFVVVNPDLLISGTSVVSTVYCMRKSVLNEKFKGTDNRSIHMLHGSIVHAFFQEVLQQRHVGKQWNMEQVANSVLKQPAFLHEMYGLGVTQDSVMAEIGKFFPQVTNFLNKYMAKSEPGKCQDVEILDVKDIEENVWSPRFGVKGKIDLTVEVRIHGERKPHAGTAQCKMMPLELKTGKASFSVEHKGQVTLYSMMSSDRREDPAGGLLLYLREGQMRTIPAHYSHKRGLIQLRNELAHYLRSSSCRDENGHFGELPPPINSERSCAKCPHLLNCSAYSSIIEKRSLPTSHALSKLKELTLGHLTSEHLEYFRVWCELMHLEVNAGRKTGISQLWCKTAHRREMAGEALCGMVLSPQHCHQTQSQKLIQCFVRHPHCTRTCALSDVGLTRGDSIVVSAENQPLIALCMGNVQEVSDERLTVLVDRDLRQIAEYKDLIYRIDKCDTYNTMATNFTNLSRLMENSDVGDKLRELIIEKRPPQFELTISKTSVEKVKSIFKKLNKPQKTAILKVLMCKDYVLIKGYPGTGKTSTIVALVRILSLLGVSVLLTSYTHSAVDNILLKLKQCQVSFVRLGRVERISPDIQPHAAEVLARSYSRVQELEEFYNKQQVVATTCLGTNHVLFSRRRFDVCIVDEASQVLQPACLGPLFVSNKFVLVGDPRQLPPLVQSAEAREKGMAESLFAWLDCTGGTYELNVQYRMNSEIVRLSNELIYNGALKCGSEAVAAGRLSYTKTCLQALPKWCECAVSGEPGQEVIFLNTQKVNLDERLLDYKEASIKKLDCPGGDNGRVKNILEGEIVKHITEVFIQLGISPTEVGVIAPYRQQVLLLRDLLSGNLGQVEVNTVDQYQGRDKQVILMSFVKQGQQVSKHVGGILQDLRRLNVALTRAKHKLILIGHIPTLRQFDPLQQVLRILRDNQIIDLPKDVLLKMSDST